MIRPSGPATLRIALAACVLAPALFWRGGILEEEAITFSRRYLDQRSTLQKVFDPSKNDQDTYQGRDLSFFIDLVDAHLSKVLQRAGIVLFIPASAVAATLLTWLAFTRGARDALSALPAATRSLVLLVLLTNFIYLSTMGVFFRSGKPMLAPVLLALALYVWKRLDATGPNRSHARRDVAGAFVLGCVASALDLQGRFEVAVVAVTLGIFWFARRRGGPVLLGVSAALVVSTAYLYLLGPWLVHAINGYWPDFEYQQQPLGAFIDPGYYLMAGELVLGYAATLFGGFPIWLFSTGAAAVAVVAWRSGLRRSGGWTGVGGILVLVLLASQVLMFGAMIIGFHGLYELPDNRLWYYPWPFQVCLAFVGLVVLNRVWPGLDLRRRRLVNGGLLVLAMANVAQWPRHADEFLHASWFQSQYDQTARLKASLRNGRVNPGIHGLHREFLYEVWDSSPRLGARAGAEIREGAGFYRTELREGRVFAWAHQHAALVFVAREAGQYDVRGELWLRSGEVVEFSLPSGKLAVTGEPAAKEGPVAFSFDLALPVGRFLVPLASNLRESDNSGGRPSAAFGLFAPSLAMR